MLITDKYPVSSIDYSDAQTATNALIERLNPQRSVLLGVLGLCTQPTPVNQVHSFIAGLQERNHSVYEPGGICELLRRAGALMLVDGNGEPYDAGNAEPEVVEIDDEAYLEVREEPELFWLTTEVGTSAVKNDQPANRVMELVAANERYRPLYRTILEICSKSDGAPLSALSARIDNDPIAKEPKRLAQFFIENLRKCGALDWNGAWVTTDAGRDALVRLQERGDL